MPRPKRPASKPEILARAIVPPCTFGYDWIEARAIYPGLGPKLKALIERSGVPVAEVARRAGINRQALYQSFAGTSDLTASTVARVLAAIGASWRDLGDL